MTPIPTNAKATELNSVDNTIIHTMTIEGETVSYKSIIGSLIYTMLATRPDLAFAIELLGHYAANPKACHWALVKQCFRYLKATKEMELVYNRSKKGSTMTFHGFVDIAWSDDIDTSRSTSGYVFISNNGGWLSK
jgi:hypothetical protein